MLDLSPIWWILRNLFRTEYRKRRREVEDVDGHHVDSLISPPEQHSRMEFEEFRVALATLPPRPREALVCTENSILIDYVTESPNVSGDDLAALFLPGPVRLALQVEEPT
jgi:hypothetical protein